MCHDVRQPESVVGTIPGQVRSSRVRFDRLEPSVIGRVELEAVVEPPGPPPHLQDEHPGGDVDAEYLEDSVLHVDLRADHIERRGRHLWVEVA